MLCDKELDGSVKHRMVLTCDVWRVTCDVWPEYYEIGDIMKAHDPCFQPRI